MQARIFGFNNVHRSFRITSKNGEPGFSSMYHEGPIPVPYESTWDATLYPGSGSLSATFQSRISATGSSSPETQSILGSVRTFELLTCANAVTPPALSEPTQALTNESAALVSPFFFQEADRSGMANQPDERTYFVQPRLTESTIQEWQGWAIGLEAVLSADTLAVSRMVVEPQVPANASPQSLVTDSDLSVFTLRDLSDWVTIPEAAVRFGSVAIGRSGQAPRLNGVFASASGILRAQPVTRINS